MLFNAGYGLLTLISIGLLVLKAYAFIDCARRPAHGGKTKNNGKRNPGFRQRHCCVQCAS